MSEPAPKPVPRQPQDLSSSARAAIRTAERCIRISQHAEAIRLLELATSQLKQIAPR